MPPGRSLPYLGLNLAGAPDEHLHALFTAPQLSIRLHHLPAPAAAARSEADNPGSGYLARISITLPADAPDILDTITTTAAAIGEPAGPTPTPAVTGSRRRQPADHDTGLQFAADMHLPHGDRRRAAPVPAQR